MFWENFVRLCNGKEKAPNTVAKEIGIPSGSVTDWKNGRTPQHRTLIKIADYFGVTVDYLLNEETEKNPPASEDAEGMGPYEKRFFAIWDQIPEEDKPELLNLIEAAWRMRGKH